MQAGTYCEPFGEAGAHLQIGLWGSDPTMQGTQPSTSAIACDTEDGACFPGRRAGANTASTTGRVSTPTTLARRRTEARSATTRSSSRTANLPFDNPGGAQSPGVFFGYKALAVSYGGHLELFGAKGVDPGDRHMPGAETKPELPSDPGDVTQWALGSGGSWVRLDKDAAPGATALTLDRPVDWAVGDRLVVATTDWHASHSETVTIASAQGPDLSIGIETAEQQGLAHAHTRHDLPGAPSRLGRSQGRPPGPELAAAQHRGGNPGRGRPAVAQHHH